MIIVSIIRENLHLVPTIESSAHPYIFGSFQLIYNEYEIVLQAMNGENYLNIIALETSRSIFTDNLILYRVSESLNGKIFDGRMKTFSTAFSLTRLLNFCLSSTFSIILLTIVLIGLDLKFTGFDSNTLRKYIGLDSKKKK